MGGMAEDWTARIEKWWKQPFSADMDVMHWALFLGLMIILVIAWHQVLRFILEEA